MMGSCKDCTNIAICGKNKIQNCDHYDVALTRGEILKMLSDIKIKNPAIIPTLLNAVKKTYKINLAY